MGTETIESENEIAALHAEHLPISLPLRISGPRSPNTA